MFKPKGFAAMNVNFPCKAPTVVFGDKPDLIDKNGFTSAVELTPLEHDRKSVKTASMAENENLLVKMQSYVMDYTGLLNRTVF